MTFQYAFVRQEIECLIELLEANSDVILHDRTAGELATELCSIIGWTPTVSRGDTKTGKVPENTG